MKLSEMGRDELTVTWILPIEYFPFAFRAAPKLRK